MKEVLAEDISVGDLIYLEDNDMIPCDMVVLSTSQVESFQDFLIHESTYTSSGNKHFFHQTVSLSDLSKLWTTKIGHIFRNQVF